MQVRTEVKGSGVGARALGLPTHRSVSAQEFEDYYADLSGAILDDSYFDLVVFGCFPTAANHLLSAAAQSHNKANPHITASVGAATQADKRESIFAIAPPEKPFGGTLTFNGESRHSGRMRIQNAGTNQVAESGSLPTSRPSTQGGSGFGSNSSSGMRQMTDSGYSYVDRVTIDSSLKALHTRLVRIGPFAMSYLGAMFRRHDNDKDGLIDLFEFRAALKDTVAACASPHTGGGISSASVEHPLTVSDTDSDAVFASAIQFFAPETANSQRPVIPLEKFHQSLRGPLSKSRRAAVLSLFTQLDKDASGCIPIGHLMQSFRAEGHPVVHAGKATVTSIYRQFQDSFGEAFRYEDSAGAAGARFDPGAAGDAYRGYGDGMVRLPFFESWNEGISSLVGGGPSVNGEPFPSDSGSDNDFNLVAFSVWQAARASSNALTSGSSGPTFDARAMLQKSDDTESGLLSSMQKLGSASRAGGQANVSSTAFEIGAGPGTRAGIARQQHMAAQQQQQQSTGVAGSSLVIPPSSARGMPISSSQPPPPSPSQAPYAAQASRMIANRTTPNTSRFFSDELGVVNGGSGTNVGMNGGSRLPSSSSSSIQQSHSLDPELDSAIKMGRSILQRRGFRGGFQLLRSIELASGAVNGGSGSNFQNGHRNVSQQQAPLGSAYLPIPQKMMAGIIRDSGLGLSNQQLDIVASRFQTPKAFLDVLFPQLSPSRADIVRRAFDAVFKQAAAQNAIIDGSPALSVLQLSYLSARHPEVKCGKRSEEDVLREFLATFSGPTIVDGEGETAIVTFDGFSTYYTIVSFFVPEDATFTTQLFDTWSLFSIPSTEGAAGLAYNLYSSGYEGFEGTGKRHSPKKEAEQRSSVSLALGQGPGYSRANHPRGPGQDHPPQSAYQGGFGVDNKRDFTSARPGWGIERF
jgi:Ca2+-binding EF-hand superfamily protein